MTQAHVPMLAAADVLVIRGLGFVWPSAVRVPLVGVGCMAVMMFMRWSMCRPSRDEHEPTRYDHAQTHDQH